MRNADRRLAVEKPPRRVRWTGRPSTIQTRVLGPGRVWLSACKRYRITRYLEGSGQYLVSRRLEFGEDRESQRAAAADATWVMVAHARSFATAKQKAEQEAGRIDLVLLQGGRHADTRQKSR